MTCASCGSPLLPGQRFCPSCGTRAAEEVEVAPVAGIGEKAERRLVTVLFADLSGFTAMSETKDPEEVQELTNLFLKEMVEVVHRYGGTVDKFMGDAVMALFGAPHAHEDDAERAVAAAMEMRQVVAAVSERESARLPVPFEVHTGINTGWVVAGYVGSLARSDYTVLGDEVNLAARLEDASVGGQVLVAETTYKMTRHAFSYTALPPIAVKGKREPVPVFELRGKLARRRSQRGLQGITTPFVGRAAERATLNAALEAAARGTGALITVGGAAGVGKSRLLREVRASATARGLRWVQAGTSSLSQGGALTVWSDAVQRLLSTAGLSMAVHLASGTDDIRPPMATIAASASLAEALAPRLSAEQREQLQRLDAGALRGRLFLAVRELLESETAQQGLVLVLEDLHWADAASFELLRSVTELTPRLPLLLIATFRSDADTLRDALPPEDGEPGSGRTHIELAPLTDDDCRALAVAVLGADDRMAQVRERLMVQAEGNPLYLEEIFRALVDQGAIERVSDTEWRPVADNVEMILPPSLQGLLLDRIDHLPEERKRLLQIGAVAGRQFPAELVSLITGDGADVGDGMQELIRGGFLERSQSTGNLRFRHALMQEAAYSSLLLRHRRSYHRRMAETLEAQPELWAVPAELPAVLTYHWERAEVWNRASEWALRAGETARQSFAALDAARLYARALTAAAKATDSGLERAALIGLADAALLRDLPEDALEVLDRALATAPDSFQQATLQRRRGQALFRLGRQADAREALNRASLALGYPSATGEEPAQVQEERATIGVQLAFVLLKSGAGERARHAAEAAIRLDTAPDVRADALRLLGVIDQMSGDLASAKRRFEQAWQIAAGAGDLLRAATLTEQIGSVESAAGDTDAGLARVRDALDQYTRLGDHAGRARCLDELGVAAWHTGDLASAIPLFAQAVDEADAADEAALCGRIGLRLGRALGQAGRWSEARAALTRAGADDDEAAGEAALEGTMLELSRGGELSRLAELSRRLRETLEAAERGGRREAADRARLGLATIARRSRRYAEARVLLRAILEGAAGAESETTIIARAGLADLATREGNAGAAVTVAARALEAAERIGPASAVWYTRRVYGTALYAAGRHEAAVRELGAVVHATRLAGALPELSAALSAWWQARQALSDPAVDARTELTQVRAALSEAEALAMG